ncbi:MAG: hypothetical protein LC708_00990, partial [Actinobacteria bacterium]|nr:hypothetical protein [Actinomycetota bacterium]
MPSSQGLAPAPAGKLCRVEYWDGRFSRLWYNAAGQLVRISEDPPGTNTVDPMASLTDLTYDSARRLWKVRDPLANEAMRVASVTHVPLGDDTTTTLITYNGAAQVDHVSLPVPYDGTTGTQKPRPGHSYTYPNPTTTQVHLDGFSGATNEPNGFNAQVTFDLAGRVATVADATSNVAEAPATASFAWDEGDRPVVTTDAAGRASTVVYDGDETRAQRTGRVSDLYGPAPGACFNATTHVPNGSCGVPPPHTHTDFDAPDATAATGLALVAWSNNGYQGAPSTRAEAPGPDASGALGGLVASPWSGRYTGEITLPATGVYTYGVAASAASARVFVDDTLVADSATGGSGVLLNAVAGRHRFRIDATTSAASPTVTLTITPPGGSARAVVAADLAPRWANPTTTTSDDSLGVPGRVRSIRYESLATGVVKEDVVDPGGLNLVTTSATETAGWRRPT